MIKIYTDGACSGNPGPGGWGYVIVENGNLYSSNGSESKQLIIEWSSRPR